ncbi:hypothetical protein B0T11DRAFT_268903 [Plectosphaerella cucumerina]|uniref:Uncharacterized protein n=1 Tax=Plectosphaerella cucumerina TaxID=40658 RepID=A0A8K0X7B0_9PEZI|nr:hypothetical protein B0T11DRAFT_268903 [Plectosphaerella cucumerina]
MPEGRESPKPEDQSDRQVGQTSHGQGTDDASNKGKVNEEQLKNLSSNPKGPLEDEAKAKLAKN